MFKFSFETALSTLIITVSVASLARGLYSKRKNIAKTSDSTESPVQPSMDSFSDIASGTRQSRSETIKAPVQPSTTIPYGSSIAMDSPLRSAIDDTESRKQFDVYNFYERLLMDEYLPMPVAAILVLTEVIATSQAATMYELVVALEGAAAILKQRSPNPVSLTAGCDLFIRYVTTARQDFYDFTAHKAELVRQGKEYAATAPAYRDKIAEHAFGFIKEDAVILTHSYSRVVMKALLAANKRKRISVYVTEARPKGLGMRTYNTLTAAGVPCTVILDSAVAYCMDKVDLVLVGSEAVVESGGLINAVGTLSMAIIAKASNKPFYALAESYKFLRFFPLSQYDLPINNNTSVLTLPSQKPTAPRLSTSGPSPMTPRAGIMPHSRNASYFTTAEESMSAEQIAKNPDIDYTRPDLITLVFSDVGILTPDGISSFLTVVIGDLMPLIGEAPTLFAHRDVLKSPSTPFPPLLLATTQPQIAHFEIIAQRTFLYLGYIVPRSDSLLRRIWTTRLVRVSPQSNSLLLTIRQPPLCDPSLQSTLSIGKGGALAFRRVGRLKVVQRAITQKHNLISCQDDTYRNSRPMSANRQTPTQPRAHAPIGRSDEEAFSRRVKETLSQISLETSPKSLKRSATDVLSDSSPSAPSKLPRFTRNVSPYTSSSVKPDPHPQQRLPSMESRRTEDPRRRPAPQELSSRMVSAPKTRFDVCNPSAQAPSGPTVPSSAPGPSPPPPPPTTQPLKVSDGLPKERPKLVINSPILSSVQLPSPPSSSRPPAAIKHLAPALPIVNAADPDDMDVSADEGDPSSSAPPSPMRKPYPHEDKDRAVHAPTRDAAERSTPLAVREETPYQFPLSACPTLDQPMVTDSPASMTSTIRERQGSIDGERPSFLQGATEALIAVVKPFATSVRYRTELEIISKEMNVLQDQEDRMASSSASPSSSWFPPPDSMRSMDPRLSLKRDASQAGLSVRPGESERAVRIKILTEKQKVMNDKCRAENRRVETLMGSAATTFMQDVNSAVAIAVAEQIKNHSAVTTAPEPALGLELRGMTDAEVEVLFEEGCNGLRQEWQEKHDGVISKCQQAFEVLNRDRDQLSAAFHEKFEEVGSCAERLEASYTSLSDEVASTTGRTEELERKAQLMEETHERARELSEGSVARLRTLEQGWIALNPFESKPGEDFDPAHATPNHTLRGRFNSMHSQLSQEIVSSAQDAIKTASAAAFSRADQVKTSLTSRIDAIEKTHSLDMERCNSSTTTALEDAKAFALTKIVEAKATVLEDVDRRTNSIMRKVEAGSAATAADLLNLKTSFTIQLGKLESAHAQELRETRSSCSQQITELMESQNQMLKRLDARMDALAGDNASLRRSLHEERVARQELEASSKAKAKMQSDRIESLERLCSEHSIGLRDCQSNVETQRNSIEDVRSQVRRDRQFRMRMAELIHTASDGPHSPTVSTAPPLSGEPRTQPAGGAGLGLQQAKREYGSPDTAAESMSSSVAAWANSTDRGGKMY